MIDISLEPIADQDHDLLTKRSADIRFCHEWLTDPRAEYEWWRGKEGYKVAYTIAQRHSWSLEQLAGYVANPPSLPPSDSWAALKANAAKVEKAQKSKARSRDVNASPMFDPEYKSHVMLQAETPDVKGEDGLWRNCHGRRMLRLDEWLGEHAGEPGAEYVRRKLGEAAQA